jgi:hypothetical protein
MAKQLRLIITFSRFLFRFVCDEIIFVRKKKSNKEFSTLDHHNFMDIIGLFSSRNMGENGIGYGYFWGIFAYIKKKLINVYMRAASEMMWNKL